MALPLEGQIHFAFKLSVDKTTILFKLANLQVRLFKK